MYLSMFRVIRTADQTPAKEVLEEFLRFIGCMVNDNPITDWQGEQPAAAGTENIDILLRPAMGGQQAIAYTLECPPGGNGRVLWMDTDSLNTLEDYQALLQKIIAQAWGTGGEQKVLNQLQRICAIFFQYDLFGFFQCKHSFRIINMQEVYGPRLRFGVELRKIDADKSGFIADMYYSFLKTAQALDEIEDPCLYTRYARINIEHKIRGVCAQTSGLVQTASLVPAKELLRQAEELYSDYPDYDGTLLLASSICKSDSLLYLSASNYFRLLLETARPRENSFNSVANYEYGRYLERVYRDWDRAIRFYRKAAELNPRNYQAQFKLGCYEAQHRGDYISAIEVFQKLRGGIAKYYSGDEQLDYTKLPLKCIQYLYKTDIWLWILNRELQYTISAGLSLEQAHQDALEYQENRCLKQVYASEKAYWDRMQAYHKDSQPVQIMLACSQVPQSKYSNSPTEKEKVAMKQNGERKDIEFRRPADC